MSQQSTFQFGFIEENSDDFITSESNRIAYEMIKSWPKWSSNIVLIYGDKSCGKTHLAKIWQKASNAKFLNALDVYTNRYDVSNNYIIDGIEKISDEAAFFHFFNRFKENGNGSLLLTSSKHPAQGGIRLADLRSRLSALPSAGISRPDDEMLRTIFVKKFAERQLKVDIDVINYLITRVERSFTFAEELVVLLDKQALREKKNITIPFVRVVLGDKDC